MGTLPTPTTSTATCCCCWGRQVADNDDDGEATSGQKLAGLLELMGANNVLVVVSRWFGGVHLGPARFKHIASDLTGRFRSCKYDDISVGVGLDTEPIFHKRQVSIVLSQQPREMSIVFECYDNTFFCLALARSTWSCRA